jgi:hypothetical protein
LPPLIIGASFVAHGLITGAIGFAAITNPNGQAMAMPSWVSWWPGPFGTSWLFEAMQLGAAAQVLGGLVWLASAVLLIGGGLGWIGFGALEPVRLQLLIGGAAIGLLAMTLYFHPFYLLAVLINVATLGLLWSRVAQTGTV